MFGFGKKGPKWTESADVVVLGTGGAGLVAAIAAHDFGAKVVLLEKSASVGGTTAVSGGVVWVPNNPHMKEVGVADSRAEAATYIRTIAAGRSDEALLEAFLDRSLEMLAHLEAKTPATFQAVPKYADYHPEHEAESRAHAPSRPRSSTPTSWASGRPSCGGAPSSAARR